MIVLYSTAADYIDYNELLYWLCMSPDAPLQLSLVILVVFVFYLYRMLMVHLAARLAFGRTNFLTIMRIYITISNQAVDLVWLLYVHCLVN